jgi:hypothetical protein
LGVCSERCVVAITAMISYGTMDVECHTFPHLRLGLLIVPQVFYFFRLLALPALRCGAFFNFSRKLFSSS